MTVTAIKQFRLLIVDDEDLARQRVHSLLAPRSDFEVIGECATGAEAVRSIRELQPDVVLLDVQMPELDGFDVISEIGAQNMPLVIFATAFDGDRRAPRFALSLGSNWTKHIRLFWIRLEYFPGDRHQLRESQRAHVVCPVPSAASGRTVQVWHARVLQWTGTRRGRRRREWFLPCLATSRSYLLEVR